MPSRGYANSASPSQRAWCLNLWRKYKHGGERQSILVSSLPLPWIFKFRSFQYASGHSSRYSRPYFICKCFLADHLCQACTGCSVSLLALCCPQTLIRPPSAPIPSLVRARYLRMPTASWEPTVSSRHFAAQRTRFNSVYLLQTLGCRRRSMDCVTVLAPPA
jgi:hypothetical protein